MSSVATMHFWCCPFKIKHLHDFVLIGSLQKRVSIFFSLFAFTYSLSLTEITLYTVFTLARLILYFFVYFCFHHDSCANAWIYVKAHSTSKNKAKICNSQRLLNISVQIIAFILFEQALKLHPGTYTVVM